MWPKATSSSRGGGELVEARGLLADAPVALGVRGRPDGGLVVVAVGRLGARGAVAAPPRLVGDGRDGGGGPGRGGDLRDGLHGGRLDVLVVALEVVGLELVVALDRGGGLRGGGPLLARVELLLGLGPQPEAVGEVLLDDALEELDEHDGVHGLVAAEPDVLPGHDLGRQETPRAHERLLELVDRVELLTEFEVGVGAHDEHVVADLGLLDAGADALAAADDDHVAVLAHVADADAHVLLGGQPAGREQLVAVQLVGPDDEVEVPLAHVLPVGDRDRVAHARAALEGQSYGAPGGGLELLVLALGGDEFEVGFGELVDQLGLARGAPMALGQERLAPLGADEDPPDRDDVSRVAPVARLGDLHGEVERGLDALLVEDDLGVVGVGVVFGGLGSGGGGCGCVHGGLLMI